MQEWINTGIASLAVLIGIATAVTAYFWNKKSISLSNHAIKSAEKANEIALGKISEFPIISICFDKELPTFDQDISKKEIMLRFTSKGKVSISGVVIKIYPLNGLIYQVNDVELQNRELTLRYHRYDFPEAITKNGMAHINIGSLLLSVIKPSIQTFKNPSCLQRGSFNVVVSPIKLGQDIAVGSINYGSNDREVVGVDFIPSTINEINIEEMLKTSEKLINIFSGYPDET